MKTEIMHYCKIRIERMGSERIRASFFFGTDEDHHQKAGELVLHVGEYQNLMCALGLGLQQMTQRNCANDTKYVPIRVTLVGEKQALEREDMLCGKEDEDKVVFP